MRGVEGFWGFCCFESKFRFELESTTKLSSNFVKYTLILYPWISVFFYHARKSTPVNCLHDPDSCWIHWPFDTEKKRCCDVEAASADSRELGLLSRMHILSRKTSI